MPLSRLPLLLDAPILVHLRLSLPLIDLGLQVIDRRLLHVHKALHVCFLFGIRRDDHLLLTLLARIFFIAILLSDQLISDPDVLVEVVLQAWI